MGFGLCGKISMRVGKWQETEVASGHRDEAGQGGVTSGETSREKGWLRDSPSLEAAVVRDGGSGRVHNGRRGGRWSESGLCKQRDVGAAAKDGGAEICLWSGDGRARVPMGIAIFVCEAVVLEDPGLVCRGRGRRTFGRREDAGESGCGLCLCRRAYLPGAVRTCEAWDCDGADYVSAEATGVSEEGFCGGCAFYPGGATYPQSAGCARLEGLSDLGRLGHLLGLWRLLGRGCRAGREGLSGLC